MTAQIAKSWFRAHPHCVVTWHWRWDRFTEAMRERTIAPRTAVVRGACVVFNSAGGRSELGLMGIQADVRDGELTILDAGGNAVVRYKREGGV